MLNAILRIRPVPRLCGLLIILALTECNGCKEGLVNRFTFHPSTGIRTDLSRFEAPFRAIYLETSARSCAATEAARPHRRRKPQ